MYPEGSAAAGNGGVVRPSESADRETHPLDVEQGRKTTTGGSSRYRGWKLRDIDVGHVFKSQHYGTMFFAILSLITLAVVHWTATPRFRPYFSYDASISYIAQKDSVTAAAAVLVPLASLLLSLFIYEFIIYRKRNLEITNACSTTLHFFLDAVYCFIFALTFTEISKFAVGSFRPGFLQACNPKSVGLGNGPVDYQLASPVGLTVADCTTDLLDTRKGFPSGHASTSTVVCTYAIIYLIWAGYFRGGDAAFLGLDKKSGVVTGFRGRHRIWRELGHGVYLMWILLHFAFIWGVGLSRYNDNKHTLIQVFGGWFLGVFIACISATRACALHKYIFIHDLQETAF
ncbi:hypothetical protein WJX72_011349 [[Myrmecia] bisecta]|uniref:Phosphatidic acid phosphatase type 2/haloperoxidase domain-containing protein n=1 Tax=[Myrmecia] bisecta TaxID=41462 RepID=A0AAW1Q880_9CHLO